MKNYSLYKQRISVESTQLFHLFLEALAKDAFSHAAQIPESAHIPRLMFSYLHVQTRNSAYLWQFFLSHVSLRFDGFPWLDWAHPDNPR